jgi:hypothetical protein
VKVQVIQLDPSDDLPTALEKLRWSKAPRVVLVWPAEGSPTRGPLDLTLLKREAERAGAQMGIATRDPRLLQHARRLAIPTFTSPDQFPARGWRRPEIRELAPPERSRTLAERLFKPSPYEGIRYPSSLSERDVRRIALSLLALAWAGVAAFIVPSAQIVIKPRQVERTQGMTIAIDAAAPSVAEGLRIQGVVHKVRVQGDLRVPSSGTVVVPLSSSRGEMVFTNLGTEAVHIPQGLGIRAVDAGSLRLVTLETADLPARKQSKVTVDVEADAPGSAGNLPAGTRWAIEGRLGLELSAANPSPTSGGKDGSRIGVSQHDLDALEESLTARLLDEAHSLLLRSLETDQTVPVESLRVEKVLSEAFDAQAGDPADSLGLHLELEVSGLSYHPYDVFVAANKELLRNMPAGWYQVPGSMNLTIGTSPHWLDDMRMGLKLEAEHKLYPAIEPIPLRRRLRGMTAGEAGTWLEKTLQLDEPAYIRVWPPWFPWLPWADARITFKYPWETG